MTDNFSAHSCRNGERWTVSCSWGLIGIAICVNVLNNHVSSSLVKVLSPSQLEVLLRSAQALEYFPQELQSEVRNVYSEGYNKQTLVMSAFAAASMISTLLVWEKVPRKATLDSN